MTSLVAVRGAQGARMAVLLIAVATPAFGANALVTEGTAASPQSSAAERPWPEKIDPELLAAAAVGPADALIVLAEQADLGAAARLPSKEEKGCFVFAALAATAQKTQPPLLAELARRGLPHQPFWIANMIAVRADAAALAALAGRPEVGAIEVNRRMVLPTPGRGPALATKETTAIEWNISKVKADQAWALGYTGQGAVVAGQDTGYQWDHPALKPTYRGWDGSSASHDHNWHDAIHASTGPCGANALAPCDDHSHGSHTMGTMVGDDGAFNQIGMAPGARWIGCRNMDAGNGTPATYSECFQYFVAPTDLAGGNPDPALAPHVINNSWGCPPAEGCTLPAILQTVVENVRAAGIVVVASAGNAGSDCSTILDPPAIYDAAFSVGATRLDDTAAVFSSRGPITVDGSGRLGPDIAAPGQGVRSSVPTGQYGSKSGTSMAGPHVAGLVALMISAEPRLAGQVDEIERLIRESALPLTTSETCGGLPAGVTPNNTFGHGRIDALAAVQAALTWVLLEDDFETGNLDRW